MEIFKMPPNGSWPLAKTRWLIFIILYLIAAYLSLTPKPGAIFEHTWDKSLHLICWAGLGAAMVFALLPKPQFTRPLLYLFISSALIEAGQYLVPGRYFSLLDILANGLGVIAAYIGGQVFLRLSR